MAMTGARRLTRLSLLVALGLALYLVERQLPPPVPVPGVRLGLANAATLVALALEGPAAALAVWGARFLLAGIVGGGLFSPGFLVGGAGGLAAWAAMAGFARWGRFGTPGISVAGAVAHHLGQLGAAAVLTATPEVLFLLPALVGLGAPVGFLTGTAVDLLLRRLSSVLGGGGGAAAAKSRRPDLVLTGAVLVLALVLALARPTPEAATAVEVTLAGRVLTRLDLTENGEFPVETAEGHLIVQVRAGAVRVLEADCPDQICVLTGWVRSPGGMIVCAPYRVVVRITGSPALGQPDVILR